MIILFSRNFDPSTDLVDLEGKVAIVIRGNVGIGLAIVQDLARAGAKVYLAARATRERTLGHYETVLEDDRYLQG